MYSENLAVNLILSLANCAQFGPLCTELIPPSFILLSHMVEINNHILLIDRHGKNTAAYFKEKKT